MTPRERELLLLVADVLSTPRATRIADQQRDDLQTLSVTVRLEAEEEPEDFDDSQPT